MMLETSGLEVMDPVKLKDNSLSSSIDVKFMRQWRVKNNNKDF